MECYACKSSAIVYTSECYTCLNCSRCQIKFILNPEAPPEKPIINKYIDGEISECCEHLNLPNFISHKAQDIYINIKKKCKKGFYTNKCIKCFSIYKTCFECNIPKI